MRDNTEISARTAPKTLLERHLCSVDGSDAARFLNKIQHPCDGIRAATFNIISQRRHLTFGGLISTHGGNSTVVGFKFKNDRYKEIRDTRKFNIESLIGNVGGYIGLFLGFAIWQLPDAVRFLNRKFLNLTGGKIY